MDERGNALAASLDLLEIQARHGEAPGRSHQQEKDGLEGTWAPFTTRYVTCSLLRMPKPFSDSLLDMLAVLILEHPSNRMKEWIGRLQIQWMMTHSRSMLNVREGFWRGITTSNLYSVFAPPEVYEANLPHLADYGKLFGDDFCRCRRDIRPFLPSWAQTIRLTEELSDDEEHDRADSSAVEGGQAHSDAQGATPRSPAPRSQPASEIRETGPVVPLEDISVLRRHLVTPASVEPKELFHWLMEKLAAEGEKLGNTSMSDDEELACWAAWCEHWEERLDHVIDLLEQRVVMELFMQSLRRLYSLDAVSLATVYLRVDVEDEELRWPDVGRYDTAKHKLRHSVEFAAYCDANTRLSALVEDSGCQIASPLLKRLSEASTCFFATLSPDLCPEVARFETMRTKILLEDLQGLLAGGDLQPWRNNMDVLMDKRAMTALKLTKWQLRQLLLPGANYEDHLTTSQASCFRHKLDHRTLGDDSKEKPLAVTLPEGLSENMGPQSLAAQHKHPTLRKFFGILAPPTIHMDSQDQASMSTQVPTPTPAPNRMPAPARSVTRSPGPRPGSKTSNTSATTPAMTLDDFIGSRQMPVKRGASPHKGSQSKVPRLSFQEGLRSEFRAELEAERQQWWNEFDTERARISIMKAELQSDAKRSSDELKLAMDRYKQECMVELKATAGALKADITQSLSSLQKGLETGIHSRSDDLHARLRADFKADLQEALRSNVEQASTLFQSALETHSITEKVPIGPGQDGYLGEHCPVPAGWSGTQAQYEGQLERAAWVYILQLDESDTGVDADENAIKDTLAQFPELVDEHIITALNHVHQRAYLGPVRRHAEDGGDT